MFPVIAFFYSMAGLGGGSAYTLWMWLNGLSREDIVVISLSLNVLVASLALKSFAQAGFFSLRYWLLLLFSLPAAYMTANMLLSPATFDLLLGLVFLFIAGIMLLPKSFGQAELPAFVAAFIGLVTGSMAGLVGIGGGVLAGPLLLALKACDAKRASCAASLLVLGNSLFALLPRWQDVSSKLSLLALLWLLVLPAGMLGGMIGSQKLKPTSIHRVFAAAVVLAVVGKVIQYAAGS